MLDGLAGTTKWNGACLTEIEKLHLYKCFRSQGRGGRIPTGFQCIKLLWVFDVKHDLRFRARLVAGGHMTKVL
jgi:hypothetical protein